MLSLVTPTRGRSVRVFNCVKRIIEVSEGLDYEIVISSHPDKATKDLFDKFKDSRVSIHYKDCENGIEAWNHAASFAQGDCLKVSDDDLWYHPDWWKEAMDVIDPTISQYVGIGDFWNGPDSAPWPERVIGTRKFFCEILGGVLCIPHYKAHHDDVEKGDKARTAGVLSRVAGYIEHRHYVRYPHEQRDITSARAERWYGVDEAMYQRRKAVGFPLDYEPVFGM